MLGIPSVRLFKGRYTKSLCALQSIATKVRRQSRAKYRSKALLRKTMNDYLSLKLGFICILPSEPKHRSKKWNRNQPRTA